MLQSNKQQCEKSFNKYISKNCHIVLAFNYAVAWAYSAISGALLEIETI